MSPTKMVTAIILLISTLASQIPTISSDDHVQDHGNPAMIEIPSTLKDILEIQAHPEFKNHPGLLAAQEAIRNMRSAKNTYILLIGLAGAGKSSTLNFLFGRNLAVVNDMNSEIVEYSANIEIPELGIRNSQLRIIDTPGLGSSDGDTLGQNAKILASLLNYFNHHDDLKHALPNVVLIFSKFDDNRMSGPNSGFVEILKGYSILQDAFTPSTGNGNSTNIIYVLTRFLSETKKVQRKPEERVDIFRETIQNYTIFPGPIVISLAENEAEEEELPKIGDNYQLPNKELYPQNLIDKIMDISTGPGDQVGSAIFKSAFLNRMTLKIEKMVPFKLLDRNDQEVHQMRALLQYNLCKDCLIPSEVSEALKNAYDKIDPDLRKSYPVSLQLLQQKFQSEYIKNITQIPTNRADIVTFLQGTELNMDPVMIELLRKAFSKEIPKYEFDFVIGHGYNIFGDQPLNHTPFLLEDLKYSSLLGVMIPEGISVEPLNDRINVMNFYNNTVDYLVARAQDLGLEGTSATDIDEYNYDVNFLPGYNVIGKIAEKILVTSVKEITLFRVVLNEKVPINKNFKNSIEKLPVFNIYDRNSVNKWTCFFQKYGAHYVNSGHGGGEIIVTVDVTGEDLQDLRNGDIDNIQHTISKLPQITGQENRLKDPSSSQINISINGGHSKFRSIKLTELKISNITDNLRAWKGTLLYEPIIFKSKLTIKPLSDIVKNLNYKISLEMELAAKAWLDGTLVYVHLIEEHDTGVSEELKCDDDAIEMAVTTNSPDSVTSNSVERQKFPTNLISLSLTLYLLIRLL